MILRHLSIENFRGIKHLSWMPDGRVICLVGPGDSGKTTILDAIELVLTQKPYVTFTDTDFFNGVVDKDKPIRIRATVGTVPPDFLREEKFGLYLRGFVAGEGIVDDPKPGSETVITVELLVNEDHEPNWQVVKDSRSDPKYISWKDRQKLGAARIGSDLLKQFAWGRGSALTRLTEEMDGTGKVLTEISRAAQRSMREASIDGLKKVATEVTERAKVYGLPLGNLAPGLDTQSLSFSFGALSLHDDNVPMRAKGLGSRRLAALAIQSLGMGSSAICLVDELEQGLEPYRIVQVLRQLCDERTDGQVMLTSHSPTVLITRTVDELRFVRNVAGNVTIAQVGADFTAAVQPIARTKGRAFLGRMILACEGKTEEGFCLAFDEYWAAKHDGQGLAYRGIVPVECGGQKAEPTAMEFARLGYPTVLLCDSDRTLSPDAASLNAAGVEVVQWDGGLSIEERIALDLPLANLQTLMNKAFDLHGQDPILQACQSISKHLLSERDIVNGPLLMDWIGLNATESEVRAVIGKAAKKTLKNGWFKDIDPGVELGRIVIGALPQITGTDLAVKLEQLEARLYGN